MQGQPAVSPRPNELPGEVPSAVSIVPMGLILLPRSGPLDARAGTAAREMLPLTQIIVDPYSSV